MSDSVQPPEGLPKGEKIALTHHMLGTRPFVLIQFKYGGEGDDDLRADLEFGGGITSTSDVRDALVMMLDSLHPEGAS